MCIYVTELKINKHIKIKLVFPKNEIKNMFIYFQLDRKSTRLNSSHSSPSRMPSSA